MNPAAALAGVRLQRTRLRHYIDTAPIGELTEKKIHALTTMVRACDELERKLTEEIENG